MFEPDNTLLPSQIKENKAAASFEVPPGGGRPADKV